MKDEKGGIGVLIGVKPKKADSEEDYDAAGSSSEAKKAAARALMSAFKAGDEESLVEALDSYLDC